MKKTLLSFILAALSAAFSFHGFGQISGYYQEDFEGTFPPSSWQVVNVLDPTQTWQQSSTYYHSGFHSAYLQWSPVDIQGEDWLILPQFTVAPGDSFSFWLAVAAVPYPPDSTYILVSTTDDNLSSFTNQVGVLSEGDNYPTSTNVFQYYAFSLDAYAGQNIYVAFKNRNIYGDGVAIDLVTIGAPPELNASAESIDVPDFVSTTSPTIPAATVKNSSATQQSFPVTMTITGGYSSTKNVTDLAPGATQQVYFDSWTPVAGTVTVAVQTQLDGDGSPSDDTLSKMVTALDPLSGFYQEDFEGTFPPAGWQVQDVLNQPNTWHQSSGAAYSGTNSAYLQWSPTSDPGEDWLILPQWSVASTDSFSFWLALAFVNYPPDSTLILVSTTDANLSSFSNKLAILSEGDNYPNETYTFKRYSFSLQDYAGQNIYVALKNRNTNGDGLYVDLVQIGTPASVNATAVSIDVPGYFSTDPFSPMATVKNSSLSDAQTFSVTMSISGGYTSTKDVVNLPAGATQQVTFDSWTPLAGDNTISIQTQLAGDLNPADDTLSVHVNALEPFTNYGWTSQTAAPSTVWDEPLASVSEPSPLLFSISGVSAFSIVSDVNVYDPVADSWSSLTSVPSANYQSSGAAIGNKIYVIGGSDGSSPLSDNQIYDIANDSWSNGSPMPNAVQDYALGNYHDSLLYYIGGFDGTFLQSYVQIYDPGTDSWTTGTNIPVAGSGWRGGIVGNKIVVAGDYTAATYVGTIDESNPSNITWIQADDFPSGSFGRPGGAASLITSSGLVVFTGGDPDGTGTIGLDGTFAFDVNTNSWKIGPKKITAVNNLCNLACVAMNDSLYLAAVGGYDGANEQNVNEWLNLGPYGIPTSDNSINAEDFNVSAFPNPFSEFTFLSFTLDHSSSVKMSIVDVAGREVQELCNKKFSAGTQMLKWNSNAFAAGVYFCKMEVGNKIITKKLVKLK